MEGPELPDRRDPVRRRRPGPDDATGQPRKQTIQVRDLVIALLRNQSFFRSRGLVELDNQEKLNPVTCRYINRLSDLLFVAARWLARRDGGAETLWKKRGS